jgi:hypothetical protein
MRTATTSSRRRLESDHLFLRQSLERYSVAYSTSFKDSATCHAGSGLSSFHVKGLAFQTRASCTTAPLGVRLELRPPLFSQWSPFMQERYPEKFLAFPLWVGMKLNSHWSLRSRTCTDILIGVFTNGFSATAARNGRKPCVPLMIVTSEPVRCHADRS